MRNDRFKNFNRRRDIPGGISEDGKTWHPARRKFLVPIKALVKLVRAKFRALLRRKCPDLVIPDAAWRVPWILHTVHQMPKMIFQGSSYQPPKFGSHASWPSFSPTEYSVRTGLLSHLTDTWPLS